MNEMKITPRVKKWFAAVSMILLGASQITAPVNLKEMIPEIFTRNLVGQFSLINLAAYGVLIGAYWVFTSQTE
jgi:hypothetical protein